MSKASPQEILGRELEALIATGDRIISLAAESGNRITGSAITDLMAWASGSGHIIRELTGKGSAYEVTFQRARDTDSFNYVHGNNYDHLCEIQGALKGLKRALDADLLYDMRRLLQADIFADFLEMAEHLHSEGYKDPAAVLLGGVLEDGLRKLSESNNLPLLNAQGKPLTIEPMNVNLSKASVYPPLTKKQITSWADLRNNAAHGRYNEYTAADVKDLLFFVQRFLAEFMQ
jgi:hypothetical protein